MNSVSNQMRFLLLSHNYVDVCNVVRIIKYYTWWERIICARAGLKQVFILFSRSDRRLSRVSREENAMNVAPSLSYRLFWARSAINYSISVAPLRAARLREMSGGVSAQNSQYLEAELIIFLHFALIAPSAVPLKDHDCFELTICA